VTFGGTPQFCAVIDPDHWCVEDNDKLKFDARITLLDRAQKLVRLTKLPHLLQLHNTAAMPEAQFVLPTVGTVLTNLRIIRYEPKVGAWLMQENRVVGFLPTSKLDDQTKDQLEIKKNDLAQIIVPMARVVGTRPLEAWALLSADREALELDRPFGVDELKPGVVVRRCTVTRVGAWGVELRLSETLRAVITNAHVSDAAVAKVDPRKYLSATQKKSVDCRILTVEPRRVTATLKKRMVNDNTEILDSWIKARNSCGLSFLGLVTGFHATAGLAITFYGGVHGRIPPNSLAARAVRPRDLGPGDLLYCAVVRCLDASFHSLDQAEDTPLKKKRPPILALCLAPSQNDSARTNIETKLTECLAVGRVFGKARISELVHRNKKLEGALVVLDDDEFGALVARLRLHDATDDGLRAADWLRFQHESHIHFPVVILQSPCQGELALVSAAPLMIAAHRSLIPTSPRLQEGQHIAARVVLARDSGLVLRTAFELSGIVPKSLLADAFIDDASKFARPGDAVRCEIVRHDHANNKLVLRMTEITSSLDFATLYASTSLIGAYPTLGRTRDGIVSSIENGEVRIEMEDSVLWRVPSSEALECAAGDTVKVRPLYSENNSIICTMQPELVRAGRKKRRSALSLTIGAEVNGKVLHTGYRYAVVLLSETMALGLVPLCDHNSRHSAEQRAASVRVATNFVVKHTSVTEAFRAFDHSLPTPFMDFVVLELRSDTKKTSLMTKKRERAMSTDSVSSYQGRSKLRITTDIKVGASVSCRVLEIGEGELKLSLRTADPSSTRASAILDISDVFVDQILQNEPEPLHPQQAFVGLTVGTILDTVVLDVSESKSHDGRTHYKLIVGVGDGCMSRKRPSSWRNVEVNSIIDAVVTGIDGDEIMMAMAPGVRGHMSYLDAVNAVDSESIEDAVKQVVVGARMQVSVVDIKAKLLTPWFDETSGVPRSPEPGDVIIARKRPARSVAYLDRSLDVPGRSNKGRICATECVDITDFVDFLPDEEDDQAVLVRAVVLPPLKKSKIIELSTRSSRLALALSESNKSRAIAADPLPQPGDIVPGFVSGVDIKGGVFIRLSRNLVGRVLKKDVSDGYIADLASEFFVGRLVAPVILSNPDEMGRVELSLRHSDIQTQGRSVVDVSPGAKLTGRVTRIEDYGVFVKLDDAPRHAASGLAHVSEIADNERITDLTLRFSKGDKVKALVIEVDDKNPRKHRVSLSLKPSHFVNDDVEDSDAEDEVMKDIDDEEIEARVDALLARDSDEDEEEENGELTLLGDNNDEESEDSDSNASEDDSDSDDDDVMGMQSESRGLQWDDEKQDDSDSDAEEEEEVAVPVRKKSRREAEAEARARETELAEGAEPRSIDDFERMVLSEPDSGRCWTRYMAYRVAETDAVGAREVAERALKSINYRKENERLLVWKALIRLEHEHGSETSHAKVVDRAIAANDPESILVYVAELHTRAGEHNEADAAFRRAHLKVKGSLSLDTWTKRSRARLAAGDAASARSVLDRALQANAGNEGARVTLLARFAVAEFDIGNVERAKTIFDDLTKSLAAKRLDVWQLYIAKIIKTGDIEAARILYSRLAKAPLPPKAMHTALRRFIEFEKRYGNEANIAKVRQLARSYVDARKEEEEVPASDEEMED